MFYRHTHLASANSLISNASVFKRPFCSQHRRRPEDYKHYFAILGIPESANQSMAREAFLKLAKRYHPDSKHIAANEAKFQDIETAYRKVIQKINVDCKNAEGEFGIYYEQKRGQFQEEEIVEKDYGIKHTAPQHRQYLSYEGVGSGTPSEREKYYRKYKAMKAAENVLNFKVSQVIEDNSESSLVAKDKAAAQKIRTRYGIERVVEDLIQESMARGDFDNLPNAGKPLQYQNYNPFVDVVTHKLNQVLIDNGYAPEWVMLEKEIRGDRKAITESLATARSELGPVPLSPDEECYWKAVKESHADVVEEINRKIDKYNLVVPIMSKQMVHFPFERETRKVLESGKTKNDVTEERQTEVSRLQEAHKWNKQTALGHSIMDDKFGIKKILSILKNR